MLDSFTVDSWVADAIWHMVERQNVEISLVILNTSKPRKPKKQTLWQRIRNNRFLYYRFDKLERSRANKVTGHGDDVDVSDLLKDVPVVEVKPKRTKWIDRFPTEVVEQVRAANLDLMFRFGFRIIHGDILSSSRYGVFSFHHDDSDCYRGGPPGFWEVYDGTTSSAATLQILSPELDGGLVFGKVHRRTHPTSPGINRRRLFRSGTLLVHQLFDFLLHNRPDVEQLRQHCAKPAPYTKGIYRAPKNHQMVILGARILFRSLKAKFTLGQNVPIWAVGIGKLQEPNSTNELPDLTDTKIEWMQQTDQLALFADPWPVVRDNQLYLFVEQMDFRECQGRIACLSYSKDSGFGDPEIVLETDHHLSFPALVEDKDQLYMVPEQATSNKIIMYRCEEFPGKWIEHRVLIDDFSGADTVLHFEGGKWWLFTTNTRFDNSDSNLYLFYADNLADEFQPHPQNPLRSSLNGSRMAGKIIEQDGRKYRPAQNCEIRYGESMSIFEIEELTTETYRERFVKNVNLTSDTEHAMGCHTLQIVDDLVITDGKKIGRKLPT